ncbi:MAG TPA: Zn-ribbon domain-containing OB-fold protein [Anaerolineaceae bacterium]
MTEQTAARPFTAAAFNQYLKENKLMGARCAGCGAIYLPPRSICPACHASAMEWVELSGKGVLAGFTVITNGPTFMTKAGYGRDNPYISGIVKLAEGPGMSARILGLDAKAPETIKIGTPLSVEFLTQGEAEARKTYLAFRA